MFRVTPTAMGSQNEIVTNSDFYLGDKSATLWDGQLRRAGLGGGRPVFLGAARGPFVCALRRWASAFRVRALDRSRWCASPFLWPRGVSAFVARCAVVVSPNISRRLRWVCRCVRRVSLGSVAFLHGRVCGCVGVGSPSLGPGFSWWFARTLVCTSFLYTWQLWSSLRLGSPSQMELAAGSSLAAMVLRSFHSH